MRQTVPGTGRGIPVRCPFSGIFGRIRPVATPLRVVVRPSAAISASSACQFPARRKKEGTGKLVPTGRDQRYLPTRHDQAARLRRPRQPAHIRVRRASREYAPGPSRRIENEMWSPARSGPAQPSPRGCERRLRSSTLPGTAPCRSSSGRTRPRPSRAGRARSSDAPPTAPQSATSPASRATSRRASP